VSIRRSVLRAQIPLRVTTKISAAVSLLVVVAVASVLITPDPTDDLQGTLHPHKTIKCHSLVLTSGLSHASFAERLHITPHTNVTPPPLPRLLCVFRC